MTCHAHNYAKSGLNRLHQFKECGQNCFRFNILFTVKLIKLIGEFLNDTFLRNNYTFLSRPSLPLNKKRYGLQNVHKLRKPRLIPQTLCQQSLTKNKLNYIGYLQSGVNFD